jgi:hypothetical protein
MVALQFGREFENQHSGRGISRLASEERLTFNRPTALNVRFWEDSALTPILGTLERLADFDRGKQLKSVLFGNAIKDSQHPLRHVVAHEAD